MTTTTKTLEHSSEQLMEKIVDPDNLAKAWNKVRSNHGAPGPDRITIDDFPDHSWFQQQRRVGDVVEPGSA